MGRVPSGNSFAKVRLRGFKFRAGSSSGILLPNLPTRRAAQVTEYSFDIWSIHGAGAKEREKHADFDAWRNTVTLRIPFVAFAALALLLPAAALASDTPKPTDILFNRPHISNIAAGTVLDYKFTRKPSNEKMLGAGFTDDITVTVESDATEGKKNVLVQMYTGDRARDPQRITGMDGNPMMVVCLDNAVSHFRELAGGDNAYLKNTFSRYLAERATIKPVKILYKGEDVDGYEITATPYADDPAKSKMGGFENATFKIALSEKIPGYLARVIADINNTDKAAPTLVETTTLEGVGDVK